MTLREDILTARDTQQDKHTIAEKYHEKRVKAIREDGGPYDAEGESGLTIHIVDLDAFESGSEYRLNEIDEAYNSIPVLSNPYSGGRGQGDTVKHTASGPGVATTTNEDDVVRRYTHIANVGIVEAATLDIVASGEHGRVDGPHIGASTLEGILVERTARMMNVIDNAGIEGPYSITFTLWGVSGVQFIYRGDGMPMFGTTAFETDTVAPFGIEVESAIDPVELRNALAEPLSSLWQAAGYDSPETYTDGEWEIADDLGL